MHVAGGKAASIPPHTWERGSAIAERSDPDTPVQEVKPWGRCTLVGRRLPCSFPCGPAQLQPRRGSRLQHLPQLWQARDDERRDGPRGRDDDYAGLLVAAPRDKARGSAGGVPDLDIFKGVPDHEQAAGLHAPGLEGAMEDA